MPDTGSAYFISRGLVREVAPDGSIIRRTGLRFHEDPLAVQAPAPRLKCKHCDERPVAVVALLLCEGTEPHLSVLCGAHAVGMWDSTPRSMRHSFQCVEFEP